ncbi:ATP-binding protein [Corallococcus llansteffanensis]|uniref:histidine kinase n=1 Tax=Corallococcus llansteffanensis TaxID=2316731 RepID=A0A3A8PZB6_9BACT|nr:ATP-binding protein [Corallococcus llansteffanensis]RKH60441.1 histidine kinase [Corallococcus llansteffanensis]
MDFALAQGSTAHHPPPPAGGSHRVQFYEDPAFLFDVVARFLEVGFQAGEPAVIIATEIHRKGFKARLKAMGFDVERALADGRLVLLDARETLAKLMVWGMPDEERFQQVIGPVLDKSLRGAGGRRVRAYGEMVDLLLRDSNPRAALLLEAQWNDLGRLHPFSLLCAYAMGGFQTQKDAQVFHDVCSAHAHVSPTEAYTQVQFEEQRLREVAALQQRSKALESEIEHRKRVEKELLAAVQLRDDFLAIAGHELRTPLTALQLQLHSLTGLVRDVENPRVKERLERAQGQAQRLGELTEELLDVVRLGAGRPQPVVEDCDLAELSREVVDRFAEAVTRSGCQLQVFAEEPARGRWERTRIEQVMTNLLSNALKYGAGQPVELWVKAGADRATLVVRDGGIGIPLEAQARIFDRFERAVSSSSFGGLGLGLWIARQVVEAHGGVIHVESEPGRGATFTVELPYSV